MSAKLLVIGLDACEATLVEQWVADGDLPHMGAVMKRATTACLGGPMDTLPGAIWPEIVTGQSVGRQGFFFHPAQIHTGEATARPVAEAEQDPAVYYWNLAAEAGYRVAVIDQPQVVLGPSINGLQVLEWGCHDRTYSVQASPPALLDELRARYGAHPIDLCDAYAQQPDGHERLLQDLLDGLARKSDMLLDILNREDWDLFTCAISESHCVGHQFWSYHDTTSPYHDPAASAALKTAIRTVYRQIDVLVGRLIAAAGDESRVMLFASHGMGPYIGGYQLVPEILARLGMSSGGGRARRSAARMVYNAVRRYAPFRMRPFLKSLQALGTVRAIQSRAGALTEPLSDPGTRAAAVLNNRAGAIRLNLAGREPFGRVQPGTEADALIEEIREEFMALADPATGRPIVSSVCTSAEAFGPDHHPDVPDIMVVFRRDIGPIESSRSDRVGTIHVPIRNPANLRTGDHTDASRVWIAGPGIARGKRLPDGHVTDIAPTVLDFLNVPIPDTVDGRPLPIAG